MITFILNIVALVLDLIGTILLIYMQLSHKHVLIKEQNIDTKAVNEIEKDNIYIILALSVFALSFLVSIASEIKNNF
jgi:hypothetical protein